MSTQVKQPAISLQQLKTDMQSEAEKRTALVEQGRRAYRFGIEEHNCPLRDLSARNLWHEGYRLERKKFDELLRRNGGTLR